MREGFKASQTGEPGCVIYAGPAPPMPLTLPEVFDMAGQRTFGARRISGTLRPTVDLQNPEGSATPVSPNSIPIPGYQVMLGGSTSISAGVSPITPESLESFVQICKVRVR